jgi:hypothetical protein
MAENLNQPAHHHFRFRQHVYVNGGIHVGCCGTVVKVEVMISVRVHNPEPYVVCIHPSSCTRASPFWTQHDIYLANNPEQGGVHFFTQAMEQQINALITQIHTDGVEGHVNPILCHIRETMAIDIDN